MTTATDNSDLAQTAAATASRLRLIQLDMADETGPQRQEYLLSEIRQAMETIPQHRRLAFLDSLGDRFPVIVNEPAPIPVEKDFTPQELLDQLAPKGKDLPLAKREVMLKQLHQAWGIAFVTQQPAPAPAPVAAPVAARPAPAPVPGPAAPAALPPQAMEELIRKLNLPAGTVLDPTAIAQLAGHLVGDFAVPLQPLVWKVYRSIQPAEGQERPLGQSIQGFLQGRNPQLAAELLQLRQVIAAMVNSIPHMPRRLYDQHLECLNPPEIEDAVKAEGGFALFGADNKYWAKYKQLASKLQPSAVDEAMRQVMCDLITDSLPKLAKPNGSAK